MQQIIFFFIRNKNFLLFAVLFFISIMLTVRSHSFHNTIFISSANVVSGATYSVKSDITKYFGLVEENDKLVEENMRLRTLLEGYKANISDTTVLDTLMLPSAYNFIAAKVINNSYSKTKNYLTINKGWKDSVTADRGVISSKGIIGIVNNTSKNYARVQTILNTKSQINAKLKKSEHFGSLIWNTKDPNVAQLIQIPRLAPLVIGDTIVTGGKSTLFPKGILIGTVKEFNLGEDDSYTVDVALFNDMTNLKNVYIIENIDAEEILTLEKETDNAKQ